MAWSDGMSHFANTSTRTSNSLPDLYPSTGSWRPSRPNMSANRLAWQFVQTDNVKADWKMPIGHLFIDTSRTCEQTTNELREFEPFVWPGGIMTMHDSVSYPDVRRAVSDYLKGRHDSEIRISKQWINRDLQARSYNWTV